jgi:intracellular septation protein
MTDQPASPEDNPPAAKAAEQPAMSQLLVDLGPVAIFVVVYNVLNKTRPDDAIYIATGVFIAATLAAIAWCKWKRGKIPPVLIVTGILVTVFGGLTMALHDENFLKLKPTIVYLFYAAAIFGSLLFKQNIWKLLFQHVFVLPDRIWTILAVRWGLLFVALAIANEYIRHTQSTEFWVNARLMIFFPAILLFALANAPLTLKHAPKDDAAPSN